MVKLDELNKESCELVSAFCKRYNLRCSQFNMKEMRDTALGWELEHQLKALKSEV